MSAFRPRNFLVLERNENAIEECLQQQLTEAVEFDDQLTTDQVAEQVADVIGELYPLPTRWIIAVYTDERERFMLSSR